jgi:hypothetical protein
MPQVLAGLGLSLLSGACQIWLERLQPLFLSVAILSLAYQIWLVRTRPQTQRRATVKAVLASGILLNFLVIGGWLALLIRYR